MRPAEEIEEESIKLNAFRIHVPVYDLRSGDSNWEALYAQLRVLKERMPLDLIDLEWPNVAATWWRRQAALDAFGWMAGDSINISPTHFWENYEKESVK